MLHSIETRGWVFAKGYGSLSFAKNNDKNLLKNISKNLSGKSSQKDIDHVQKSTTDAIKTVSMLKSNLWDQVYASILVKGTVTVPNTAHILAG